MKRDSFEIFHWEFYKDGEDSDIYVYENRSGDVIGYMQDICDLNLIRQMFDNKKIYTEEDVNNFIEDNIIWF